MLGRERERERIGSNRIDRMEVEERKMGRGNGKLKLLIPWRDRFFEIQRYERVRNNRETMMNFLVEDDKA